MVIENIYNANTYFIAHIKGLGDNRAIRSILPASEMAFALTDITLPEHFNCRAENINHIKIVEAYKINILSIPDDFKKLAFSLKAPIGYFLSGIAPNEYFNMVQGFAFNKWVTEAFLTSSPGYALKMFQEITPSAIACQTISAFTLKTIQNTNNGFQLV